MSGVEAGFVERFLQVVDRSPDRVALEILESSRTVTYAALLASIERLSGQLASLGVERGDRVIVMLPSGAELVSSLYALASLGAVAVPLSDAVTPHELGPMIAIAQPRAAIVGTSRAVSILSERHGLSFALWTGSAPPPAARVRMVSAATFEAKSRPLTAPAAEDIVGCHFTYKGIGRALGALHRYSSYSACIEALAARRESLANAEPDETHLVMLPMFPVYGLLTTVFVPLSTGTRLVVSRFTEGTGLLELLVEHRIRLACLVPPLLSRLVGAVRKNAALSRRLHPRLELVSGGSLLEPELIADVAEVMGVEIQQGYGTTETLPVTATRAFARGAPEAGDRGSVGASLRADVRVVILDHTGAELATGSSGAVALSGPTLMTGYLGDAATTERFLPAKTGLFHTGDIGRVDAQGRLWFEGRSLPFAKNHAQMVDLREVEDVVRLYPEVTDARAVGANDARYGECVQLTVRVRDVALERVSEKDLKAHLRAHLSAHKVPRGIRIVAGGAGP